MSIDGRCRARSHTRAPGSQCTWTSSTESIDVPLRKQREWWICWHQQQWKQWKQWNVKALWSESWIVSGWGAWACHSNVRCMQIPTNTVAVFARRTRWDARRSSKNSEKNWRSKEIERLLSADEIVRQHHHRNGKLNPVDGILNSCRVWFD